MEYYCKNLENTVKGTAIGARKGISKNKDFREEYSPMISYLRYCDFGCRARAQAEHYTECEPGRRERGASDMLRLVARQLGIF